MSIIRAFSVTFFGETEHFSGKNGALRWTILEGKQKHNVQKPNHMLVCNAYIWVFLCAYICAFVRKWSYTWE